MQSPPRQVPVDFLHDGCVGGVAGPGPHPDRDAVLGDGHPDDGLGAVGAVVLGVSVPAEVVVVLGLEVRARRVEQQHVALQAQAARNREEHVLLDRGVVDQEGVHRPVGDLRISAQAGRAGQEHVMGRPLQRGALAARVDRPVRHQREQHPLDPRVQPAAADRLADRGTEPELGPQVVQQPRRSHRAARQQPQALPNRVVAELLGGIRAAVEVLDDRPCQPPHRVGIEAIGPPERMDHLHLRPATRGVPHVMRQLHVLHLRAVLARLPRRRSHVHHHRIRPCVGESGTTSQISVSRQQSRLQPRMLLGNNGNPLKQRDY